jgi:phage gp29-like protein
MKNMAAETKKPEVTTDEIATIEKDFDIYLGWIKRLENPDPVLRTEAAGRGIKLYDEVDRDAHASSVLQQRYLALVGKEWEIIPGKSANSKQGPTSTDQDQLVADYVSSVLENCNFDQARQELLKAILYGFYNLETIWKVENGNLVISKFIGKHPRRFVFTPERELHLLTLQDMIVGEALPPRKFITFTYGDSDNPYGRGLGQRIWWPVWFKKNGIKFWMIFLEKFGMPTVKGKYPSGTDKAMQDRLMEAIETIQTDTGIKIPDTMDIEFLEAARAGTVSYEQLCGYMDKQISKAVLGQTASSEGTPGKLGNEKSQEDVRQEILEADADLLDGCLNDNLIKWIVDLNFPGVIAYPKVKTYAHAKPDLTAQSVIDKTLIVDIGLPVTKSYLYETYGIPVPQEGDDLVTITLKTPQAPLSDAKFADATVEMDVADYLVNQLADLSMADTDKLMAPLKKLTNSAKSLTALRDGLVGIFKEMNPADLGNTIARALMIAEMSGRYEVADETGTLTPVGLTEKKSPEFASEPAGGILPSLMAVFKLPFKEQESFFKKKLNVPTLRWTDLWKEQHTKAFSVAGAYKDDLLTDFRGAVDKAITEGTTLAEFRKDFDGIVARNGWSYNGSRNWRSEVIYSTNIRTAHAAGRWEQLNDPAVQKAFPYLEYRHGNSIHPRPEHLAWNGITLPRDDPWWNTHYPPNGWGCKCTVLASTRRDQQKAAANGMATAPPSPINPQTGEPVGIDKGWGYNVGTAA